MRVTPQRGGSRQVPRSPPLKHTIVLECVKMNRAGAGAMNKEISGDGATLMKTKCSGAGAGAMFMK